MQRERWCGRQLAGLFLLPYSHVVCVDYNLMLCVCKMPCSNDSTSIMPVEPFLFKCPPAPSTLSPRSSQQEAALPSPALHRHQHHPWPAQVVPDGAVHCDRGAAQVQA